MFRLANKTDLTPANCKIMLDMATGYCEENPKDLVEPWEILNVFINYVEGNCKNPQMWVGYKQEKLIGCMITMHSSENPQPSLYMRLGYIDKKYRGNGMYEESFTTLENYARKAGYKSISIKTHFDPKMYGRFVGKMGFKYSITEYVKEI